MRDLLILSLFVVALGYSIRRTWIAVLLWTWLSLMNPHKLGWGIAYQMPLAAIAAGAAFVSMIANAKDLRVPKSSPPKLLIAFFLWCCLTTLLSYQMDASLSQLEKVAKIQLMTLVAALAIHARRHIEAFVWVNALSVGFYGIKGGIFTLLSGGSSRVWGPPGSFIEDNNELGLALVMIIPLLNYLRLVSVKRWTRTGLVAAMLLCSFAALGTQSRGALLAIVAMTTVLWWRSRNRPAAGVVLGIAAVGIIAFMPDSWSDRMSSIRTYEADGSAVGRLEAWTMAFNLANDRFFGGGFMNVYQELFDRYAGGATARAAHSIYFQVLGEHGWIGLILFLSIGASTWWMTSSLRRQATIQPGAEWVGELAGMVQVSMVGYAVGGAFLSLAYFDLPYNLIIVVVAMRVWMDAKGWTTEPTGLFSAGEPTQARARTRPGGLPVRPSGASSSAPSMNLRPPP